MSYNSFQDQLESISRFGQSAFKSGELDRKEKDRLRGRIYAFVKRTKENKKETTISDELDKSRSYLEDYIHDFCNPTKVPDVFFDYLANLQSLIKSTDKYSRSLKVGDLTILEDLGFDDIIFTLADEWNKTTEKILRIAFEIREPPLQVPSVDAMFPKQKIEDPWNK